MFLNFNMFSFVSVSLFFCVFLIFIFLFALVSSCSTLHYELPTPIETRKTETLAFIDFYSGLACFPALPSPTHEWKFSLHTPTAALLHAASEKTGEIKFTSIEILWAEWTTRNKCDKKVLYEALHIHPGKSFLLDRRNDSFYWSLSCFICVGFIRLWRQSVVGWKFQFHFLFLFLLLLDWRCSDAKLELLPVLFH